MISNLVAPAGRRPCVMLEQGCQAKSRTNDRALDVIETYRNQPHWTDGFLSVVIMPFSVCATVNEIQSDSFFWSWDVLGSCFNALRCQQDILIPGHTDHARLHAMRAKNRPTEQRDLLMTFHGSHSGNKDWVM